MAESVASTAYGPMVLVALEQTLPDDRQIINDPLAYQMLPLYMKALVRACYWQPLRNLFFNLMDSTMPGLRSSFPSRKRYMGDKTLEALNTGVQSVVILGAGLDTLAYRIPQLAHVQVYEVDLPENIAYKRKKLIDIFGDVPAHVTLIPINFEQQALDEMLAKHGYLFNQQTLFIWEAVTQYLSENAVRNTFRVLAKAQPGSRLVFTYVLKDFIQGENLYGLEGLYNRFCVKDQVWLFGIDQDKVADFIGEYGWTELEQAGTAEFIEQYLKPAQRTESIAVIERAVYAEKAS
jgi:methyltransferase (TIGR00027 family)